MRKPLKKRPAKDVNEIAFDLVRRSTGTADDPVGEIAPAQLSAYMAAIGRKGGKIGGKRRLETMSPEERSDVASKAARAMWKKRKAEKKR